MYRETAPTGSKMIPIAYDTWEVQFALKCIKRWLEIREKFEDRAKDRGFSQLRADIDHSALLHRLLEGKEPLPEPPPLKNSYPDYNSVEGEKPDHPWWPAFKAPEKCQSCQPGHRWEKDKEVHPRCAVCGEHGHLSCLKPISKGKPSHA